MEDIESQRDFMYGYQRQQTSLSPTPGDYNLFQREPSLLLKKIIQYLGTLPVNTHVLDLGCGDGILEYNSQNNRNYSFTGIDLEPRAIAKVKEYLQPTDTALVGDITNLKNIMRVQQKKYDVAISWRVLHGINPAFYDDIFTNIFELLKTGATFYVAVASNTDWKAKALGNEYNPLGVNDCANIMFRDYGIPRKTPFMVHFFSEAELTNLAVSAGFKKVGSCIFQESSGYEHLKDRPNTYLFIEFRK